MKNRQNILLEPLYIDLNKGYLYRHLAEYQEDVLFYTDNPLSDILFDINKGCSTFYYSKGSRNKFISNNIIGIGV